VLLAKVKDQNDVDQFFDKQGIIHKEFEPEVKQ